MRHVSVVSYNYIACTFTALCAVCLYGLYSSLISRINCTYMLDYTAVIDHVGGAHTLGVGTLDSSCSVYS